jgi:glucose-1-phosphate thymidylyltransferase
MGSPRCSCWELAASKGFAGGSTVYAYPVSDLERFGVAAFDAEGRMTSLNEKPAQQISRYTVTRLHF